VGFRKVSSCGKKRSRTVENNLEEKHLISDFEKGGFLGSGGENGSLSRGEGGQKYERKKREKTWEVQRR